MEFKKVVKGKVYTVKDYADMVRKRNACLFDTDCWFIKDEGKEKTILWRGKKKS